MLNRPGWPKTYVNPPVPAFWVLGPQVCTTTPDSCSMFLIMKRCWDFFVCINMIVWVLCVLCRFDMFTLTNFFWSWSQFLLYLAVFGLLLCHWENFAFIFTRRIALQLSLLVMSLSTLSLSDAGLIKWCMLSTKPNQTKSKQTIYTQTDSHSVSWWNASELCLGSTCNLLILQFIETPSRGPGAADA